jgi:hypothetical protein
MANETITAILKKKAKNGKGFLLNGYEEWFNADEKAELILAKIDEGTEVEVTFFKKGVNRIVTLIKIVGGAMSEAKTEAGFKCEVCGKELKDGKFKKCFMCNKKGATKKEEPKETEKKGPYTNCAICGKELKGKGVNYPNCWDCKDKESKEETKTEAVAEQPVKKEWTSKSNYGSAEDVAGKEVGCAANCAAQILAGAGVGEVDEVLQRFRVLFNGILEHIRMNK